MRKRSRPWNLVVPASPGCVWLVGEQRARIRKPMDFSDPGRPGSLLAEQVVSVVLQTESDVSAWACSEWWWIASGMRCQYPLQQVSHPHDGGPALEVIAIQRRAVHANDALNVPELAL